MSHDPGFVLATTPLVGLFCLLVGLAVWWQLPWDDSARALLFLAATVSLPMLSPPPYGFGRLLALVAGAFVPLLGVAALNLAIAITGSRGQRMAAGLLRVGVGAAVIVGIFIGVTRHLDGADRMSGWLRLATVALLGLCLVVISWTTWRATGPDTPLRFRHSARVFGVAVLIVVVPFGLSSVVSHLAATPAWFLDLLQLAPVALFHLVVGLALVRGRRPVDVTTAACRIAEARSQEAIAATVLATLVDEWGFERADLLIREASGGLRRAVPGKVEVRGEGLPLPDYFAPREFVPVAHVLTTKTPATAWDPAVRDRFWNDYRVEAIVPITAGNETVALLVLGPAAGGRPLTEAQMAQVTSLALLIAVAVENARTLERLQQEAEGLEQRVAERTQQLSSTRTHLEQAHGELMEAEMQAMLGQLIAGIVHEMNTPIGTLASSVDTFARAVRKYRPFVAERAEADPAAARALRAIDAQEGLLDVMTQSRDRLNSVLSSLKRFIALDAAEVKLVNICESIDDALTLVASGLSDTIRVVRDYPEQAPMVRCPPVRLNQVFLNLVQNAAGAFEDGGQGEIRVSVSKRKKKFVIEICDDGRGIPGAKLAGILEFAFTAKADGRIGLRTGLPACRKHVAEMGGNLTIESTEGQGTTVVVELPAGS